MKKIAYLFLFLLIACTDDVNTRRTLENSGFTDIEIKGYDPFTCGEDDMYHTGFRAKNSQGKIVEGVVCCGLLVKGCTVRF